MQYFLREAHSFYISTYWGILRVDENYNEIDIDLPVGPDGIYFLEKVDRKLYLKLEEIGTDLKTNYDYYIDLDRQTIEKSTKLNYGRNPLQKT